MSDPATDPYDRSEEFEDPMAAAPAIGSDLEVDERTHAGDVDDDAGSDDADHDADDDGGAAEAIDATPDADAETGPDGAAEEAEPKTDARPDYLGDLQRVTAEFANFRKQTEKRNQELLARATMRLAEALLPVLDACDAAARQGVVGVEPIHAQLLSVLGQEGLEVIDAVGERFDPNRHEAVMTEPADEDGDAAVVAEVLRTGYSWKGRVFRPAMVKVRG